MLHGRILEQSLDLVRARELDVFQRGHDGPGAGPAVLEDGVGVRGQAAAADAGGGARV
jgi:hypothetical protein